MKALLLPLLLFVAFQVYTPDNSKIISQEIKLPDEVLYVAIELDGLVKTHDWDKNVIKIEMEISFDPSPDHFIEYFNPSGKGLFYFDSNENDPSELNLRSKKSILHFIIRENR